MRIGDQKGMTPRRVEAIRVRIAHGPDELQRVLDVVADGDVCQTEADIDGCDRGADRSAEGGGQQEGGSHGLCRDPEGGHHADDDGQEGGHHDEESGGTGAVQMGHEGGQDDGDHDHHPAFAGLFGQEVDDRVKQELEKTKTGGRSAALVMNANPFTLGHQYLVETAAAACDTLHLFVVSEDASLVSFAVRKKLVAEGVKHLPNVILHDSGPYIISNATFPSYFLKDEAAIIDGHARLDLAVFTRIAKALNITARYVGEEPASQVTGLYNQIMCEQLPKAGIDCIVVPRKEANGRAISASTVRQCLQTGDWDTLETLLPRTTLDYFRSQEAAPVLERIRKAGNVVHY